MRTKRFVKVLAGVAPLMLYAGAACAATSGFASLNTSLNSFGDFMQNGVGYGVGIGGAAAFAYHFIVGSDWAHTIPKALTWGAGGAVVHNAGTLSGVFAGASSALIQPVVMHPMTHAAIHAAGRLLG
jgi:TrbC/VIRB2 pilin